MMEERLTWEEIRSKYPNKWVGLKDIEKIHCAYSWIKSAIVRCVGDSLDEITNMLSERNEQDVSIGYTMPENLPQIDCFPLEFWGDVR